MRHRRRICVLIRLIGVVLAIPTARFVRTRGTVFFLNRIGYGNAQSVPYARGKLSSGDQSVRRAAAEALGRIGPKAGPAIPDLLLLLRTDCPEVARAAAWGIGGICAADAKSRPLSQEAIDGLIDALDHPDGEIRRCAAYAIDLIGPRAHSAIPTLRRRLQDEHMAYMAAQALGGMGPSAPIAFPISSPYFRVPNLAAALPQRRHCRGLVPCRKRRLQRSNHC